MSRLLPLLILAALAAACGSSGDSPPTTTQAIPPTTTSSTPPPTLSLTVFRVVDGRLRASAVHVAPTRAVAQAALQALGFEVPVKIDAGVAQVALDQASDEQVASIVYTLTQFPTVSRVEIGSSAALTRADVTDFVPPILVEAPAAGASVPLTFTISGTASVFEATLVVELRRGGAVLEHKTVTASEGAPGRGTFAAELHAPSAGAATVVAYSPSAADGSRQHEQDVPVTVTP